MTETQHASKDLLTSVLLKNALKQILRAATDVEDRSPGEALRYIRNKCNDTLALTLHIDDELSEDFLNLIGVHLANNSDPSGLEAVLQEEQGWG